MEPHSARDSYAKAVEIFRVFENLCSLFGVFVNILTMKLAGYNTCITEKLTTTALEI